MKYINVILVTALAASVWVSCSKEQDAPQGGEEIRFDIDSSLESTKAQKIGLTDFQANGFQVYANVREEGKAEANPFMNAQQMYYNGHGWVYSPAKYWPTSSTASVDFYTAYTDGSDNVKILYDWYNMPQTTFYVNSTVSKQTDMLWAPPVLGARREHYSDSSVTFKFKHSLTAFFFRIKLKKNPGDQVVKIRSLTLTGFFAPKAYVIPDQTDLTKAYSLQGDWQERSYTISKDGDHEIADSVATLPLTAKATTLTGTKGYIMVLPFDYQEYTVTLVYDVTKDSKTTTHTTSHTVTSVELKAGTIIKTLLIINLDDMGSTELTATASVHDWVDVEAAAEELVIE